MHSNLNLQSFALLAFLATGVTFAQGKVIKSALEVKKKTKAPSKDVRPVSLARKPVDLTHKPVTLLTANNSQDAEQAWRTVRSYYGMEIFLEFDIGTPGQTLRILIDSGSDWFWVTTDICRTCGGVKRYDHRKSSTYEKIGSSEVVL